MDETQSEGVSMQSSTFDDFISSKWYGIFIISFIGIILVLILIMFIMLMRIDEQMHKSQPPKQKQKQVERQIQQMKPKLEIDDEPDYVDDEEDAN